MAARVRSTLATGVQALESERGYSIQLGHTVDRRWKGTEAECQAHLDLLVAAGGVVNARIVHDAQGYYILTVSYSAVSATDGGGSAPGSGDSTITIWTRERSRIEKSLWTVPAVVAALNAVVVPSGENATSAKAAVRRDIEAYLRRDIDVEVLESSLARYGVDNQAALRQLMSEFALGVESYPLDQFVIRRTQTGPLAYLINDDATANKIWSRTTLIAQATMPTDFKARVPTGFFLQAAASLQQIDLYRWQIVQEWDHADSFSTWLYGNAI